MTTSEEEYTLAGPEADGKGQDLDDGFLVKAGSLARKELSRSPRPAHPDCVTGSEVGKSIPALARFV